ncbi:helix-turn-helix domain-containing protein [Rossellomorea vietnamensis]|uniref:helix-turn-helix domain-containing protein n=1 Tax=Rossellomorea vietnamensis TaxID=218284 RepID=UPI003D2DE667
MTKAAVKNRKESFLRLYKKSMTIDEICKEIKITPATFKSWLKKDREFKEEFDSIITTK